jgi:hypothetical protein
MKVNFTLAFLLLSVAGFSQNSFDIVYSTLNTKCSNSSCHNSAANGPNFSGAKADVYAAIVGVTPNNSAAAARGEKYVFVNQPYESYLLKKCGSFLDTDLGLKSGDGSAMAALGGSNLSDKEVEYMRQWIMNGAKQTGVTIDTAMVNAYYNNPNRTPFLQKPPVPANGRQLRFGPVFLPAAGQPGSEKEYLLKHKIDFGVNQEVTQLDGHMNDQSHHFLLFKFQSPQAAANEANGIRIVQIAGAGGTVSSFDGDKDLTGAWQDDGDIRLPQGTAIFWNSETWLDLNYHVKNYNIPSVMPCDFYLNIVTRNRPTNTPTIEMKSALVNNVGLFLQGNRSTSIYHNDQSNGRTETRHLWMMSSHTHKFGTGFTIFERDASKPNQVGDTLYDGNYTYESNFYLGRYDWEHPSTRYFSPQRAVNMQTNGIRARTVWNVTQTNPVTFGFTTAEEMQLFYYMYTNELATPNGIGSIDKDNSKLSIYPNPMSESSLISIESDENTNGQISLVDMNGRLVYEFSANLNKGENSFRLHNSELNLPNGLYVLKVITSTSTMEKRIMMQN